MKRKAGPGPSGWRNSYIAGMGETRGGIAQLRLWTELWTRGRIQPTTVLLWNGQVAAPKDCGPKKDDPTQRKLRPIALEEALVKFAETAACDAELGPVLEALEPVQLGVGTPDGTVLLVSVLRAWLRGDQREGSGVEAPGVASHDYAEEWRPNAAEAASDAGRGTPVYFSSDLKNAYGLVKRSALLRGLRAKAPRLARLLATKWSSGSNTVYHRIKQEGARTNTWRTSQAWRGGGQGSRLMMIAFCCSLAGTLWREPRQWLCAAACHSTKFIR